MHELEPLIERGSPDDFLLRQLDPNRLPRHVAIIMDGNGRWANRRGKARIAGHPAGVEAARVTVENCARLGIPTLTLYAFSSENWRRPRVEVTMLMRLLQQCLRQEVPRLNRNGVRLRFIGRLSALSDETRKALDYAVAATANNHRMTLNVAFNYGGRAEIVDALRAVAREFMGLGRPLDSITEEDVARHLYTDSDPDLLIRTSGEMRLSNFLLWQMAYTEIFVTNTLWPDFNRTHLLEALAAYQQRHRRFGGVENVGVPVSALA
ncbi:MAG: isoprenyl transferase [Chloracidobacterium sp. CP2_5A]|nr:MAG: isoprenyl transferase [Chloracidobacterium sp. CP2_5A]